MATQASGPIPRAEYKLPKNLQSNIHTLPSERERVCGEALNAAKEAGNFYQIAREQGELIGLQEKQILDMTRQLSALEGRRSSIVVEALYTENQSLMKTIEKMQLLSICLAGVITGIGLCAFSSGVGRLKILFTGALGGTAGLLCFKNLPQKIGGSHDYSNC